MRLNRPNRLESMLRLNFPNRQCHAGHLAARNHRQKGLKALLRGVLKPISNRIIVLRHLAR